MMNDVIRQYDAAFVRDGVQPPTFPASSAAPARCGHLFPLPGGPDHALLLALGLALALAGCKAAVSASGSFATPREILSGTVTTTSNSVALGGSFQTGGTNLTGSINIAK
jgi:hypothetical protein